MVEVVGLSLLSIAVIAAILVFVEYKSVNYCSKKIPEMLSGDVTMTAAQMMANMNLEGHSVSIGTLYSVIYRLEKKGVITHEKISPKKFVYKVAKN